MYKVFPSQDGRWKIWYCPLPARPELHPDNPAAYPGMEPYSDVYYKNKADAQRAAKALTDRWRQRQEQEHV